MNRETQTASPKSSHLGVTLLFLIFLVILTLFAWQWVEKRGHTVDIQRTIAEYLVNVDFFGKRPHQLIAEVRATAEETQKRIKKLSKDASASPMQRESIEKLSSLIERIDALPLMMDVHLEKVEFPLEQFIVQRDYRWYKFLNEVWQDLQQFVVIEKIDNPEIELLSPSQRDLLHENIKLRLLLAQYSLLSNDQTSFQANLENARNSINHHYDKQAESVVELLNELDRLHSYTIGKTLPNVSKHLNTVRNYQLLLDEEGE